MRIALIATYWISLAMAGVSLIYLLFIFGHTEVAPHSRVLVVTVVAGLSALVAGVLHWVGLPPDPNAVTGVQARQRRRQAK